ncbi:RraA family protein [Paenibacillus sp. JMULE4]|uniref:RraA family protein n=1 Tax=Paenibacillus TaxID=44249 RepID=UPI00088078FD|nr:MULTISPECIES: RraA family protein [Paenibacillus]NTZ17813.1 RraA family protein [Paenibacillus sp. JMULE4]SDI22563.1 RraA famliy [Paenibacillus naphthalenovorans]
MTNIGFRILPKVRNVSDEVLDTYRGFVTPHLSDNMNRLNAVDASIRPIHTRGTLVGSAFTVKTRPGDNLMVHKAIDMAGPGDVIVVDAGGDLTNAIMGEIMVNIAKKNGIEGFIIDGAIRDMEPIRDMNYPLYAKGVTHRGPYKDGPGEINVPIQLGGVIVRPGDVILADMDGVVVVPYEHAEALIGKVRQTMAAERKIMADIEKGTIDRSWVDEVLRKKGCEGV